MGSRSLEGKAQSWPAVAPAVARAAYSCQPSAAGLSSQAGPEHMNLWFGDAPRGGASVLNHSSWVLALCFEGRQVYTSRPFLVLSPHSGVGK